MSYLSRLWMMCQHFVMVRREVFHHVKVFMMDDFKLFCTLRFVGYQ